MSFIICLLQVRKCRLSKVWWLVHCCESHNYQTRARHLMSDSEPNAVPSSFHALCYPVEGAQFNSLRYWRQLCPMKMISLSQNDI